MTRELIVKKLTERGYKVEKRDVTQNGVVLDGIVFMNDKGVYPIIYLNDVFKMSKEKMWDDDRIVDEIINMYESCEENVCSDIIENLYDKQWVFRHTQICLQKESKQDLIKRNLLEFEGIEAYLSIVFKNRDEYTLSMALTKEVLHTVCASEDEMWEKAYQNLCDNTCLYGISQLMSEMIDVPIISEEEEIMFVVTNKSGFRGASAILNKTALKEFADKRGVKRVFVLPSSIHECILVPDNGDFTLEELSHMVADVNTTEVAPQEQLPNNAYIVEF